MLFHLLINRFFNSVRVPSEQRCDSFQTDGNVIGYTEYKQALTAASVTAPKITELRWDIDETLSGLVRKAAVDATAAISDIDLVVFQLMEFGKGFMKTAGVPPDGFIQMALQLAYYR